MMFSISPYVIYLSGRSIPIYKEGAREILALGVLSIFANKEGGVGPFPKSTTAFSLIYT